jgi:hypothetical protein
MKLVFPGNHKPASFSIIGFASIRTVGFDPSKVIIGDVAIIMIHAGFFSKAAVWLKTQTGSDGRLWVLI